MNNALSVIEMKKRRR